MTNPTHKKTHEQFVNEVPKELGIAITEKYIDTNTKIGYTCKHGINSSRPWQILKMKHCCRKGYYESGDMWRSNTNTIEDAKERTLRDRPNTDVSNVYFEWDGRYKRLYGIKCTIHNIEYSSILGSKVGQCPECFKEDNREKLRIHAPKAWASQSTGSFVSKAETKWLDGLNIKDRQVWLEDVKYKVDGYDKISNTVYLYHGRFWHGCLETFDPEMIHPIVKVPMKDLYEKTMYYENKIKEAGSGPDRVSVKRISKWQLKFNFLPRKCFLSNKLLWLNYSYKGTYILIWPGDTIFEDYYIEKSEFILWNLRGKI